MELATGAEGSIDVINVVKIKVMLEKSGRDDMSLRQRRCRPIMGNNCRMGATVSKEYERNEKKKKEKFLISK